jgi:2-keto-4-pentenoate hydratase
MDPSAGPDVGAVAAAFATARRSRRAIPAFPGPLPETRVDSYAIQEAQIGMRGERVVGWKVAMTAPPFRDAFGEERLSGPVFVSRFSDVRESGDPVQWQVIGGGFAAVEAEFIAVIGKDMPPFGRQPSPDEVADHVSGLHIGLELAGSPLASINDLGPFAVAADCGNNDGVVIGPVIEGWRDRAPGDLAVSMTINGTDVRGGSAASVPGGPLAAVAFLARHLETRGRRLMAGDCVSTGATTGIHRVEAGDRAVADFGEAGRLEVRVT